MSMPGVEAPSLRDIVGKASAPRSFFGPEAAVRFTDLVGGTSLGSGLAALAGKSVLLAAHGQLASALTLIELEGVARRIVILPPDADPAHLPAIIAAADIDAAVIDDGTPAHEAFDDLVRVRAQSSMAPMAAALPPRRHTEW